MKSYQAYIWCRLISVIMTVSGGIFIIPGSLFARGDIPSDIGMAKDICDSIPLEPIEGIWMYPEDNITVLVTREDAVSPTGLPTYKMRVVETSDARIKPGEIIGSLTATPEKSKYVLKLFTRKQRDMLSSPQTCLAILGDNDETLLVKKEKKGLKLRFSLNPSILLPKIWRIVRIGTSQSTANQSPPVGLIKIYPSYDSNGSSRRKPRYL